MSQQQGTERISMRLSWFTSIISLLMAPRGKISQGGKPNYATQGSSTTSDLPDISLSVKSCDLSRHRRESRLSCFSVQRFIVLSHP